MRSRQWLSRWSLFHWWNETSSTTLSQSALRYLYNLQDMHVVSTTGERAYFTAADTGQIYLRENAAAPQATTTQVSASQRTVPDPNGTKPAIFHTATPDGRVAFFTSCEKLTEDSTAVSTAANRCDTDSQGQDLYAYDAASDDLTDLTVDPNSPNGADVRGVIGASDDGSYVYFVANGDLDDTGPATTLSKCQSGSILAGHCNLYLAHDGAVTFIASLDPSDGIADGGRSNWRPSNGVFLEGGTASRVKTGFVSADGTALLFMSQRQLTTFDSQGAPTLYRYSAPDNELECVSCGPTGIPGWVSLQTIRSPGQIQSGSGAPTPLRNFSADGSRVFFETTKKLVATDVNGDAGCPPEGYFHKPACQDVYEWEAEGSGSCDTPGGCLYLLSTGTSPTASYFADASASGDDVFIFTRNQLVPQDQDQLLDVYDVSVGGGLASQHQVPPPGCSGEECRGRGTSPPFASGASTAVFQGPGNRRSDANQPRRCPKGKRKVRAKGKTRCVAKQRRGGKRRNPHSNTTRRTSR